MLSKDIQCKRFYKYKQICEMIKNFQENGYSIESGCNFLGIKRYQYKYAKKKIVNGFNLNESNKKNTKQAQNKNQKGGNILTDINKQDTIIKSSDQKINNDASIQPKNNSDDISKVMRKISKLHNEKFAKK